MSKKIIILIAFLCLFFGFQLHAKEAHREHGAHVHGAGTLGIAFEQTKGVIDFKIPSESIFGFEHAAKSTADQKKMNDGLQKLENKISEMIVFDSALKCQISKVKIEVVKEKNAENHSETIASFNVLCERSPVGTKLKFFVQKFFPQIKDLDVTFLAEETQASVEAKKDGIILDLTTFRK